MKKEDFIKLIGLLKSQHKLSLAHSMISPEYNDDLYKANSILLENIFNTEQIDWIDWWMYENDFGDKLFYATQEVEDKKKLRIDSVENLFTAIQFLSSKYSYKFTGNSTVFNYFVDLENTHNED